MRWVLGILGLLLVLFAASYLWLQPAPQPSQTTLHEAEPLSGALTEPLQSLHGRVAKLLMDQEMMLESRPFRPHITLAKPGGPVTRVSGAWTLPVNTLQLYQSQRGADGRPIYHSLGQFPFSCP